MFPSSCRKKRQLEAQRSYLEEEERRLNEIQHQKKALSDLQREEKRLQNQRSHVKAIEDELHQQEEDIHQRERQLQQKFNGDLDDLQNQIMGENSDIAQAQRAKQVAEKAKAATEAACRQEVDRF